MTRATLIAALGHLNRRGEIVRRRVGLPGKRSEWRSFPAQLRWFPPRARSRPPTPAPVAVRPDGPPPGPPEPCVICGRPTADRVGYEPADPDAFGLADPTGRQALRFIQPACHRHDWREPINRRLFHYAVARMVRAAVRRARKAARAGKGTTTRPPAHDAPAARGTPATGIR